MTTLSAARTRGYTNNQTNALPISTSTTIWGGAAVGIDPTTRLGDRMRPGYLFVGFAKSSVNHIPGQQRDNFVTVIDSGEVVLAVSGAVQADVGKDVYATDDDTFVLTSSGGSFVGVAKQLVASGKLLVEIAPVSMLNAVRLAPGGTALVSGDGTPIPYTRNRVGAVTPYRLAVYGDSRANVGGTHLASSASATTLSGEKVATQFCMLRGDMQIVFNGGISGDTAANWNSASRISSSQDVASMLAAAPDLCLVQYGINDLIAGTSSATILGYLQAFAAKVIGAGIPFIFESINTAAAAPATYINGYSSAGGFGTGAAAELVALGEVRAGMDAFLAQFPDYIAMYVDTSSVSDAADGYAKTDKTYYDGAHMSRIGCRAAAALIDSAISGYFPRRVGLALKPTYPNGCNFSMLTVSSGRAANYNAMVAANGSGTCTYEVGQDDDGNWFQQYNVTVSALASGYFQMRFDVLPDWAGASPFFTLAAGDVMQGSIDYLIDNGSGGAPIVSHFLVRPRFYYNTGASNENTSIANVAQAASTNYPPLAAAESGRCMAPRLAVAATKASADMDTTGTPTAIQFAVYGVSTGTFRLRIFNPQWAKVA